ncbi:long-chain fatty acid--CoA ligase [Apibacter muscae]|uniref:AMP-dependent synthetase/ligase n=1 Tax=Apibacter muscae TaxID=2509004 RepID=UPI0011ABE8F1|nr:long-chain fatty acid--CoA ligase [Apibacter muscae]TWP30028.1 long-chain fatty acid--CoA ligase [Apibacter muscae]
MNVSRLFDIPYFQLVNAPQESSLVTKHAGKWVVISTQELVQLINQVSRGLLRLEVKKGDHIAILSPNNSTEWLIIDFAIQQIGAVTIPIYPNLSDPDLKFILKHSNSKFCFVSGMELVNKIQRINLDSIHLKNIFTFENLDHLISLDSIKELGNDLSNQKEVEKIKQNIHPEHLATIIYTSGTTGSPKGVMLSHKNLLSDALNTHERVIIENSGIIKMLSFLPICHVLERMVVYLAMYRSYNIYFAESIEKVPEHLKEIKPHIMTVVPRVIEKLYSTIYQKGTSSGWIQKHIFLWALKIGHNFQPFTSTSLSYKIVNQLVFKKWREGLGGEIKTIISGGAPLSKNLNKIFFAAGLPILEGYGLTETSPVIAVNGKDKNLFKFGTVGPLLKDMKVKIAEDGEILTQGPNVFMGYYNEEDKTKEAFTDDGWFKTGDIGEMDGIFLKITDRKKEIFKTSGGKFITPQITENLLKQSRFIEQAMVVGAGEKMPCALIQPNFLFIQKYLVRKNLIENKREFSNQELIENVTIKDRIWKEVEKVNMTLGNWEQIKKIELTPCIWSMEGGELTPTLKLKRKFIKEKYIDLYNKMYEKNL